MTRGVFRTTTWADTYAEARAKADARARAYYGDDDYRFVSSRASQMMGLTGEPLATEVHWEFSA